MPIYNDFIGLYDVSKSLKRAPAPYTSTRLVPLGDLSAEQRPFSVYGDEATLGFISSLRILWGTTEPQTWDTLQEGWSWKWNIRTKWLTITDDQGNITERYAPTWSDLAVSWAVVESHQFTYYFDTGFIPNPFYIVKRELPNLHAGEERFDYGTVDDYMQNNPLHIFFWRLYVRDIPNDIEIPHNPYSFIEELRQGLSALICDLSATADFPVEYNLFENAETFTAEWQRTDRDALLRLFGIYLFWANATASLFLGDEYENKPCYEPWMLWQMWKWLQKFKFDDIADVIFDLAPNWGDT